MWRFTIIYEPGKRNEFADAVSRHPNPYAETASIDMQSEEDRYEESILASVASDLDSFFAVTWEKVVEASKVDDVTTQLISFISNGFPPRKADMPAGTAEYWEYRDDLRHAIDGVITYKDRIVIPHSLRKPILDTLHSADQGVSGMVSRALCTVFWPGITLHIEEIRNSCGFCHRNAPSQPPAPATEPSVPEVPFELIFSDYFKLSGKYYLIVGDRLSGWTEVVQVKHGGEMSGTKGLCSAMRRVFATFGVSREVSSDGGPEYKDEFEAWLNKWGSTHRLSSSYLPKSNGRAEVAVKATKRLLEKNIKPDGSLDSDKVVRALLQMRNTPDRDCKLSPAEILFGRRLRDAMPQLDKNLMMFANPMFDQRWHNAWKAKETAIAARAEKVNLRDKGKTLAPLKAGDNVFIQNQNPSSRNPTKWDRQGVVVTTGQFDQYLVRVLGSGRLTLRNRRFLRKVPSCFAAAKEIPCTTHPASRSLPVVKKRYVLPKSVDVDTRSTEHVSQQLNNAPSVSPMPTTAVPGQFPTRTVSHRDNFPLDSFPPDSFPPDNLPLDNLPL